MDTEKLKAQKKMLYFCPTVVCVTGDWEWNFLRNTFDNKLFSCGRLNPRHAEYIGDHDEYPRLTIEKLEVVP
jgi:hypothetical protein